MIVCVYVYVYSEFGNYNNFRCDCDLVWLRNYPNCLQGQDKSIVCSSCPDDNQGDCTKSIIKFRANNCTNCKLIILFILCNGPKSPRVCSKGIE